MVRACLRDPDRFAIVPAEEGVLTMKKIYVPAVLIVMVGLLGGCAGRAGTARPTNFGALAQSGVKPPSQVEPCCRELAAGRINIAECYQRPECKAKGNACCLKAVQDLRPRGI